MSMVALRPYFQAKEEWLLLHPSLQDQMCTRQSVRVLFFGMMEEIVKGTSKSSYLVLLIRHGPHCSHDQPVKKQSAGKILHVKLRLYAAFRIHLFTTLTYAIEPHVVPANDVPLLH